MQTAFPKNSKTNWLKINFLCVLDHIDMLISKIISKNKKKHHFDGFQHEKHFKKQPQPHSQTGGFIKQGFKNL